MRGYVSVEDAPQGQIPVDAQTEIYRDPGDSERILAETKEGTVALGIADVTVSRKKGDQAPVVIRPQSEFIEIQNNGNANGVRVVTEGETRDVGEGRVETVSRDAEISIGYQTNLLLTIEREAKVEQNVVNKGEGDVIMGDHVDESTTIGDDNVINRSDIGGDGSETLGDDNIVNRSDIGGTASSSSSPSSEERTPERTETEKPAADTSPESDAETKFCISCGTEIAVQAQYCPSCGHELGGEDSDAGSSARRSSETQQFCERHERTYAGDQCPECADSSASR